MRTAATAQTAFTRQIAVRAHVVRAKRPPNFTIPWVRLHRRGTAPDSICRFGGRLVQNAIRRIETLASAPLTKWLTPADQRRWRRVFKKLTAAIFVAARLRPR